MKYSGGLDGLRGVAVLVVVLFHANVPFADGGFLGVSVFFTLSGYLITTLLLAEFEASQTISLRHFYVRRARRLLPAAYLCLLLVAMTGAWWSAAQRADLPGDLVASVANMANWRFAFAPSNYADLFDGAPSPVTHFWSLAIEEQIYLVLPLIVIVSLRRGRRTLAWVTATLLAISVTATLFTSDRDLVYNGTHTRAAELLIGVALALYLARSVPVVDAPRWRRARSMPGGVAGMLLLGLVAVASLDQGWIYRGGLPLVAVLSAVLIAAVVSEHFPNRLLDVPPLVTLGRLSYGIYLFHWPIFLLLDAERTGLGPVALLAVRCFAVGICAVGSAHFLEQPVRLGRITRTTGRFVVATASGALVVLAVALLIVPTPGYTPTEQLLMRGEAGPIDFRAVLPATLDRDAPNEPSVSLVAERPIPYRVAVIGSESAAVAAVTAAGNRGDGDLVIEVLDDIRPQCPLSTTAIVGCPTPAERLRDLQGRGAVDVVVIATGPIEDADLEPRSAAADSGSSMTEFAASELAASSALEALVGDAVAADIDVVVYSTGQRLAGFDQQLVRLAYATPSIRSVVRTDAELTSSLRQRARAERGTGDGDVADGRALKVLVVGDSTSLTLAMALHDGSDGRLDVLWAGANGCPLAAVEATRNSSDDPWTTTSCEPYETKLPPLLASFDPQVVLVVSGPIELAEHRLPGDPSGHVADEAVFAAARDVAIESLVTVTDGDVPILVADMPAVQAGLFSSREMTAPARLDALNAQIESWDRNSSQIARFAYRDALESAESTPGALRSDGVHPDAGPLEELARSVYVEQLITAAARVRAELDAEMVLNG